MSAIRLSLKRFPSGRSRACDEAAAEDRPASYRRVAVKYLSSRPASMVFGECKTDLQFSQPDADFIVLLECLRERTPLSFWLGSFIASIRIRPYFLCYAFWHGRCHVCWTLIESQSSYYVTSRSGRAN